MSNLVKDEFQLLLDGFHDIIKGMPEIEKVKTELLELKEIASNNNTITFWQKDAIVGRCNNYLKGEYGSQVKKPELSDYHKSRQ